MKSIEEGFVDKNEVHRKHMERVKMQELAEEENLKYVKTVKGADTTVYKNRKHKYKKHLSYVEQMLYDRKKLKAMRLYQFLVGLIGFAGIGVIFLSIKTGNSILFWSISEDLAIEIDSILAGCTLTLIGIIGIIGFQYRHDKISDRIKAGGYSEKILPEKKRTTTVTDYWV